MSSSNSNSSNWSRLHGNLTKRGPLGDISPVNNNRTNALVYDAANGICVSPEDVDLGDRHPSLIPHRFHCQDYLTVEKQKHLIQSLVN
jgi:hypothetical protein